MDARVKPAHDENGFLLARAWRNRLIPLRRGGVLRAAEQAFEQLRSRLFAFEREFVPRRLLAFLQQRPMPHPHELDRPRLALGIDSLALGPAVGSPLLAVCSALLARGCRPLPAFPRLHLLRRFGLLDR